MTMQSSYYYQEYDTSSFQDPSTKRQQRRPSMIYERRTSLSLMPAFNDSAFPTSLVEIMSEEVACIDTSIHSHTKASRRRSLDISMDDLCELTGDSIFESSGDDPFLVSLPKEPKDINNNNNNSNSNSNSWTSSELGNQIRVLRRTSLSFMPLCNENTLGDFKEKDFDAALDSFFHEQASEIQACGPVSDMASALQSAFDPSNPVYSLEFAKGYQGCITELVGQMETSEKSRSKVAMVKTLLVRNENKKQRFKQRLSATGLNTTKSEETRKMLLRAHYLNSKASGTGTGSGDATSSTISYAAIKDARRRKTNARRGSVGTTRYEQPAARQVSMDITTNFNDAVPSAPCSSGMNTHMINANRPSPLMMTRRVSRRRSSLAIQSFQMQYFPDCM